MAYIWFFFLVATYILTMKTRYLGLRKRKPGNNICSSMRDQIEIKKQNKDHC